MPKKNYRIRQNRDRVRDLIGVPITPKAADLLLNRTSRLLKLLAKANSISAHSELGVELDRDECMLVVKFPLDQWDEVSAAFGSCSRLRKTLKRVVK